MRGYQNRGGVEKYQLNNPQSSISPFTFEGKSQSGLVLVLFTSMSASVFGFDLSTSLPGANGTLRIVFLSSSIFSHCIKTYNSYSAIGCRPWGKNSTRTESSRKFILNLWNRLNWNFFNFLQLSVLVEFLLRCRPSSVRFFSDSFLNVSICSCNVRSWISSLEWYFSLYFLCSCIEFTTFQNIHISFIFSLYFPMKLRN